VKARLALAALLLATTARADPLPPPGYQPEMSSDEAGLWLAMDKAEQDLKQSPKLVRDPALNAYVGGLVCKLAGDYCGTVRVYIVEVPEFNAYAMPNGAVVVHTGLLLRMEDEAQLAFVLGHELTHFLHRHSLDQLHRAVNTSGFLTLFGAGAALGGAWGVGSLADLIGTGAFYAHSRDDERDADSNGFSIAVRNGYDPREAPSIWRGMDAELGEEERNNRNFFVADHPSTPERLAAMDKAAAEAEPLRSDWSTGGDAYRAITAPFQGRWIADELARGQPQESVVLFARLAAANPGMGLYRYALGEAYRKRGAAGDEALARTAYHDATQCADAPAEAWRGIGLLALKDGDKPAAKNALTAYEAHAPAADDKAMIDYYLSQL
jgi:predicted Zn-dependent protease